MRLHPARMLARRPKVDQARLQRRAAAVHMMVGRNGAAKSLCAVYDTMPSLDGTGCPGGQPRPVLSTVRLLDWTRPRPCEGWQSAVSDVVRQFDGTWRVELERADCADEWHGFPNHQQAHPFYVPFTDWDQLLNWKFGDVLMDEITGIADSGQNSALPAAVENLLAQMRRADIAVRITALNWIRANKRLREAVQAVTRCSSSLPVPRRELPESYNRLWVPRRLARWETFDAESLPVDDHTQHAYENAHRLVRTRHWIPTSPAIAAYDTNAPVLVVGTVTDAGRCAHCGGHRRAPECSCADYRADRAARAAATRPGRHGRSEAA